VRNQPTLNPLHSLVFLLFASGLAFLLVSLPPPQGSIVFIAISITMLLIAANYSRLRAIAATRVLPFLQVGDGIAPTVYRRARAVVVSIDWDKWLRLLVLVSGLGLALIGQLQMHSDPGHNHALGNWLLIAIGLAVLLAVARTWHFAGESATLVAPAEPQRLHFKIIWLVVSIGLIGHVTWQTVFSPKANLFEHLTLWALGMLTFVFAVSPQRRSTQANYVEPIPTRNRIGECILLLVLFILAFMLRGINLDREPHLFDDNEAMFAREGAFLSVTGFQVSPFRPGVHTHPYIYQAMVGLSVQLFGMNMVGARLPSALMGALTVVAVYLLGKELRDSRAGLIAALFLLTWTFHVVFSRLAMNQPADPLLGALAFYFLLRGLRHGSAVSFALSGMAIGVAQLFYLGGRLIPLVMIAYLIYLWMRDRQVIQKQWQLLLIVPIAAFLVSLPQHYFLFHYRRPITTRADPNIFLGGQLKEVLDTGNSTRISEYFVRQVRNSTLALWMVRDLSVWYGPASSIMGPFAGVFLLLGISVSLNVVWKYPKWSLPFGWGLAVVVAGSTLSSQPPFYERYHPGVIGLTLMVALGVSFAGSAIANSLGRPNQAERLALGLGGLLAAANLIFYLVVYIPEGRHLLNITNEGDNRLAHQMVAEFNEGRQVVVVGGYQMRVQQTLIVDYFMFGKRFFVFNEPVSESLQQIDLTQPFAFFVAKERKGELEQLQQEIPDGKTYEVYLDEDNSFAFYLFKN
jgi:4-amino-4-deoxy-L-arabinose transferase-like glycosyltransferase